MFRKQSKGTSSERVIVNEEVIDIAALRTEAKKAGTRFWVLVLLIALVSSMVVPYLSMASVAANDSKVFDGDVIPGYSMGGIDISAYGVDLNSWAQCGKQKASSPSLVKSQYGYWTTERANNAADNLVKSQKADKDVENAALDGFEVNDEMMNNDEKARGWIGITRDKGEGKGLSGFSTNPNGTEVDGRTSYNESVAPYRTQTDVTFWEGQAIGGVDPTIVTTLYPDFVIVGWDKSADGGKGAARVLTNPDSIQNATNSADAASGALAETSAVPHYVPLSTLFKAYGLADTVMGDNGMITLDTLLDAISADANKNGGGKYSPILNNIVENKEGSTVNDLLLGTHYDNLNGENKSSEPGSDAWNPYPYSMVFKMSVEKGTVVSSIYNNTEAYVYFSPQSVYTNYLALRSEYDTLVSENATAIANADPAATFQMGYYLAGMSILEAYLNEALPQDMTRGYVGPVEGNPIASAGKALSNANKLDTRSGKEGTVSNLFEQSLTGIDQVAPITGASDAAAAGGDASGIVGFKSVPYSQLMYDFADAAIIKFNKAGENTRLGATSAIMNTLSTYGYGSKEKGENVNSADKSAGQGPNRGMTRRQAMARVTSFGPYGNGAATLNSSITEDKEDPMLHPNVNNVANTGMYVPVYYPIQQHVMPVDPEMTYRFQVLSLIPYNTLAYELGKNGFNSAVTLTYANNAIENLTTTKNYYNKNAALAKQLNDIDAASGSLGQYDKSKSIVLNPQSPNAAMVGDTTTKQYAADKDLTERVDNALRSFSSGRLNSDNVHDLVDVARAIPGVKYETFVRYYNPIKSSGGATDFFLTRVTPAQTDYMPSILTKGYESAGGVTNSTLATSTTEANFDYFSLPSFGPCFAAHTAENTYYGALNYELRPFYTKDFLSTLPAGSNVPALEQWEEAQEEQEEEEEETVVEDMKTKIVTIYVLAKRLAYANAYSALLAAEDGKEGSVSLGSLYHASNQLADILPATDAVKQALTPNNLDQYPGPENDSGADGATERATDEVLPEPEPVDTGSTGTGTAGSAGGATGGGTTGTTGTGTGDPVDPGGDPEPEPASGTVVYLYKYDYQRMDKDAFLKSYFKAKNPSINPDGFLGGINYNIWKNQSGEAVWGRYCDYVNEVRDTETRAYNEKKQALEAAGKEIHGMTGGTSLTAMDYIEERYPNKDKTVHGDKRTYTPKTAINLAFIVSNITTKLGESLFPLASGDYISSTPTTTVSQTTAYYDNGNGTTTAVAYAIVDDQWVAQAESTSASATQTQSKDLTTEKKNGMPVYRSQGGSSAGDADYTPDVVVTETTFSLMAAEASNDNATTGNTDASAPSTTIVTATGKDYSASTPAAKATSDSAKDKKSSQTSQGTTKSNGSSSQSSKSDAGKADGTKSDDQTGTGNGTSKAGGKASDKASDGQQAGDQAGQQSGGQSGGQSGQQTGQQSDGQDGSQADEQVGQQSEVDTGDGATSQGGTGTDTGAGTGSASGDKTDDRSQYDTSDRNYADGGGAADQVYKNDGLGDKAYYKATDEQWKAIAGKHIVGDQITFHLPKGLKLTEGQDASGFDYVMQEFGQRHMLTDAVLNNKTVWCKESNGYAFVTSVKTIFSALYKDAFNRYLTPGGSVYYWDTPGNIAGYGASPDCSDYKDGEVAHYNTVAMDRSKAGEATTAKQELDSYCNEAFADIASCKADLAMLNDEMPVQVQNILAWADCQTSSESEANYLNDPGDQNQTFISIGGSKDEDQQVGQIRSLKDLRAAGFKIIKNNGEWAAVVDKAVGGGSQDLQSRMVRGVAGTTYTASQSLAGYTISATVGRIDRLVTTQASTTGIPYSGIYEGSLSSGAERYALIQSHSIDRQGISSRLTGDLRSRDTSENMVAMNNPTSTVDTQAYVKQQSDITAELMANAVPASTDMLVSTMGTVTGSGKGSSAKTVATTSAQAADLSGIFGNGTLTATQTMANASTFDRTVMNRESAVTQKFNTTSRTMVSSGASATASAGDNITANRDWAKSLVSGTFSDAYAVIQSIALMMVLAFLMVIAFQNFVGYTSGNEKDYINAQTKLKTVLPRALIAVAMIGLPPMGGQQGFPGGCYLLLQIVNAMMDAVLSVFTQGNSIHDTLTEIGGSFLWTLDIWDLAAALFNILAILIFIVCSAVIMFLVFLTDIVLFFFWALGPLAWAFYVWPYTASDNLKEGHGLQRILGSVTGKMGSKMFTNGEVGRDAPMGWLMGYVMTLSTTVKWVLLYWGVGIAFKALKGETSGGLVSAINGPSKDITELDAGDILVNGASYVFGSMFGNILLATMFAFVTYLTFKAFKNSMSGALAYMYGTVGKMVSAGIKTAGGGVLSGLGGAGGSVAKLAESLQKSENPWKKMGGVVLGSAPVRLGADGLSKAATAAQVVSNGPGAADIMNRVDKLTNNLIKDVPDRDKSSGAFDDLIQVKTETEVVTDEDGKAKTDENGNIITRQKHVMTAAPGLALAGQVTGTMLSAQYQSLKTGATMTNMAIQATLSASDPEYMRCQQCDRLAALGRSMKRLNSPNTAAAGRALEQFATVGGKMSGDTIATLGSYMRSQKDTYIDLIDGYAANQATIAEYRAKRERDGKLSDDDEKALKQAMKSVSGAENVASALGTDAATLSQQFSGITKQDKGALIDGHIRGVESLLAKESKADGKHFKDLHARREEIVEHHEERIATLEAIADNIKKNCSEQTARDIDNVIANARLGHSTAASALSAATAVAAVAGKESLRQGGRTFNNATDQIIQAGTSTNKKGETVYTMGTDQYDTKVEEVRALQDSERQHVANMNKMMDGARTLVDDAYNQRELTAQKNQQTVEKGGIARGTIEGVRQDRRARKVQGKNATQLREAARSASPMFNKTSASQEVWQEHAVPQHRAIRQDQHMIDARAREAMRTAQDRKDDRNSSIESVFQKHMQAYDRMLSSGNLTQDERDAIEAEKLQWQTEHTAALALSDDVLKKDEKAIAKDAKLYKRQLDDASRETYELAGKRDAGVDRKKVDSESYSRLNEQMMVSGIVNAVQGAEKPQPQKASEENNKSDRNKKS